VSQHKPKPTYWQCLEALNRAYNREPENSGDDPKVSPEPETDDDGELIW
jgi:hypothetical protein